MLRFVRLFSLYLFPPSIKKEEENQKGQYIRRHFFILNLKGLCLIRVMSNFGYPWLLLVIYDSNICEIVCAFAIIFPVICRNLLQSWPDYMTMMYPGITIVLYTSGKIFSEAAQPIFVKAKYILQGLSDGFHVVHLGFRWFPLVPLSYPWFPLVILNYPSLSLVIAGYLRFKYM